DGRMVGNASVSRGLGTRRGPARSRLPKGEAFPLMARPDATCRRRPSRALPARSGSARQLALAAFAACWLWALGPAAPPAQNANNRDDGRPTPAVVDCRVIGNPDASIGQALPEILLAYFDQSRFSLIERGARDSLLAEMDLNASDLVGSAERAAEFGRIQGV